MRRAYLRHLMVWIPILGVAADAEEWKPLWEEWKAALRRYEAAIRQAPSASVRARIRHPIGRFRGRLRDYAIACAGYPKAAPALIEILRYTRDREEQLWVMLQLRETHLRSKYLGRILPRLVQLADKESVRTLKEIAEGSPHEKIARAARVGLYECTKLGIGQPSPAMGGRSKKGRPLTLRSLRGKTVVLVFGEFGAEKELKRLRDAGMTVLGVGNEWPGWPDDEALRRRWNALARPRLFVLDPRGVIAGKDLEGKALQDLAAGLK